MKTSKTRNGKAMSFMAGYTTSLAVMLALTAAAAMILARLMEKGTAGDDSIGYYVMGTLVMIAFAGSTIGAMKIKHRLYAVCLGCGLAYWGALLTITMLMFGGEYGAVLEMGSMIMIGSTLAILPIMARKKSLLKRRVAF